VEDETEHSDCLCWVNTGNNNPEAISKWFSSQEALNYVHLPNRLSSKHVNWDIINMVQKASQTIVPDFFETSIHSNPAHDPFTSSFTTEVIIRKRRSAQSYDRKSSRTNLHALTHTLKKTLPEKGCPFDVFPYQAQVHLALFVHAVDGLDSGLYMLVRNPKHLESLQHLTHSSFDWHQVKEDLPFYLLQKGDFRSKAQSISCSQAIAADSAYSLGMLARFDSVLRKAPYLYPRLFWETGLVGQVLYLEAEAQDLRATGIGCFLDDEMHSLLGIRDTEWQSLYHFTVGKPVDDTRIETKPPYFHLER